MQQARPSTGQQVFRQFQFAFLLMSVIPLLICLYLITVRFFSITILFGAHGAYVLLACLFALLGLLVGHQVLEHLVHQLVEAVAKSEALLGEVVRANDQLQQELNHRKQIEEELRKEKAALQQLNTIMMEREVRMLELKQEVNALLAEAQKPARYQAGSK